MEYWKHCMTGLAYSGPHMQRARRSAVLIYLSTFAPTTSLPECIGGDLNYDYRFAWIRDASFAMVMMALLGDTRSVANFMRCLARRSSSKDSPLQIMYRLNGETDVSQHEQQGLRGYRNFVPVRVGNHAYTQRQLDSLGYLADSALTYLLKGAEWYEDVGRRFAARRSTRRPTGRSRTPASGVIATQTLRKQQSDELGYP